MPISGRIGKVLGRDLAVAIDPAPPKYDYGQRNRGGHDGKGAASADNVVMSQPTIRLRRVTDLDACVAALRAVHETDGSRRFGVRGPAATEPDQPERRIPVRCRLLPGVTALTPLIGMR
jgi:hypothetical protein